MDLFAAGLIDHNVCEERGELGRGVPRSGFAEHLAGLGVEGGVQRQGAVAKVLKAVPFGASRGQRQNLSEPKVRHLISVATNSKEVAGVGDSQGEATPAD